MNATNEFIPWSFVYTPSGFIPWSAKHTPSGPNDPNAPNEEIEFELIPDLPVPDLA